MVREGPHPAGLLLVPERLRRGSRLSPVNGRRCSPSGRTTLRRVAGRAREGGAARALERGSALLEGAAERSRPRTVAERLKANARWFAQAALSTALAWTLARELFDHPRPIFAAMGALIGVSATPAQRRRSAVETIVGVALGIGTADALVVLIGDGTLQLVAIVAGAMVAAVALGGGPVLVSEAAAAALLVVTVQPPGSGLSGARFFDSLLGGVVALAVTSLLPANPAMAARRAAAPLLAEIAATLEDVARALERSDRALAERALARARRAEPSGRRRARDAAPRAVRRRHARAVHGLRARREPDRRGDHERRGADSRRASRAGSDGQRARAGAGRRARCGRSRAPPRRLARRPAWRGLRP
jgi:hypothetical protein